MTFWFERARKQIETGQAKRAGLLATNSISMPGNRPVLESIKKTGDIFMAWSDRPWVLDGANVRVAMVGFDDGSEKNKTLDGHPVTSINSDLTSGLDATAVKPLMENMKLCFLGMMKAGPFDLSMEAANEMLNAPVNPNGRPNSNVVKRRLGGQDVTGRPSNGWIIDFGCNMPEEEAALYEKPFEYVRAFVKPLRDANRRERTRRRWWIHGEARPGLRSAISKLSRCIVTPEVAKYRLFVWMPTDVIPDHKLHVIARDDDYFLGVLHSRIHEMWALHLCSTLEDRPSYNSQTTFEPFPFPWPPSKEPVDDPRVQAIAAAAKELVEKRDAWLNPAGTSERERADRTLTNLYNNRPTWLTDAHRKLDEAVAAAYDWPASLTDSEILERLLSLNKERAGTS